MSSNMWQTEKHVDCVLSFLNAKSWKQHLREWSTKIIKVMNHRIKNNELKVATMLQGVNSLWKCHNNNLLNIANGHLTFIEKHSEAWLWSRTKESRMDLFIGRWANNIFFSHNKLMFDWGKDGKIKMNLDYSVAYRTPYEIHRGNT